MLSMALVGKYTFHICLWVGQDRLDLTNYCFPNAFAERQYVPLQPPQYLLLIEPLWQTQSTGESRRILSLLVETAEYFTARTPNLSRQPSATVFTEEKIEEGAWHYLSKSLLRRYFYRQKRSWELNTFNLTLAVSNTLMQGGTQAFLGLVGWKKSRGTIINQQPSLQQGLQAPLCLLSLQCICKSWLGSTFLHFAFTGEFILCCPSDHPIIQASLSPACLQETRLQITAPSQTPQEGLLYETVTDCQPLDRFQTGVAPDPPSPDHTTTSQGCHHLRAVTNVLKPQLEFTGFSSLLCTT